VSVSGSGYGDGMTKKRKKVGRIKGNFFREFIISLDGMGGPTATTKYAYMDMTGWP